MAERGEQWLCWAQQTFGDVALDPHERTMRFVEEAVELAQSLGVDRALMETLIARVYAKPPGDRSRELGQCLGTFETLAIVLGIDADAEASAELVRVQSIPQAEWGRRHSAKVALGIAKA